ncbi:MAG: putative toxin-antitoxin system antitoxin component (TIGR02293 family) [Rubritalea sp.]|jgi:putative toxin-antitoxin system antitoxin component (TIGR02293 family)
MKYTDEPVVTSFLPKVIDHKFHSVLEDNAVFAQTPLVERLRKGFPMKEFSLLQELLKISEEELGRYLGISPATLHRRKKSGHLETPESERVVRFARLFGIIMEVLETEAATREWLKTANPGTAGEAPLSYADTEFGAREVENLIGRIDHGVFC